MSGRDVSIPIKCRQTYSSRHEYRRGMLAPMVVLALVAVLLTLALVIDRFWLQNASVELEAAAEASALAAGRNLIRDDLLRLYFTPGNTAAHRQRLREARQAAAEMAARHRVAGTALQLQTDSPAVLRFGRLQRNPHNGAVTFLETSRFPDCVELTARRNRQNHNPVALFLQGLSGRPLGNVSCRVRVLLAHHVVGVRPREDVPVPMWPLGLRESTGIVPARDTVSTGSAPSNDTGSAGTSLSLITWGSQIDRRGGDDRYLYDEQSRKVRRGSDGIPEIVVICTGRASSFGTPSRRNRQRTALSKENSTAGVETGTVCLLDMGSRWRLAHLHRQFQQGITLEDAQRFSAGRSGRVNSSAGDSFRLDAGRLEMSSFHEIPRSLLTLLAGQIGRCRMVWLYRPVNQPDEKGFGRILCVRLVAVRLMSVRQLPDQRYALVFQPGTLVSSTVLLADRNLPPPQRRFYANPYIYKLQLIE